MGTELRMHDLVDACSVGSNQRMPVLFAMPSLCGSFSDVDLQLKLETVRG